MPSNVAHVPIDPERVWARTRPRRDPAGRPGISASATSGRAIIASSTTWPRTSHP